MAGGLLTNYRQIVGHFKCIARRFIKSFEGQMAVSSNSPSNPPCRGPVYVGPISTCFFNFFHQATPLHSAAHEGHVDTVKCLADRGADIDIHTNNGVIE